MSEHPCYLSIVIPLYNEHESLVELHLEITETAQKLKQPYEIIFIDDGSSDASEDILEKLAATDPAVRVIQFRRNYGKSAALNIGFSHARGQFIVTMDSDLQDDPHEIPNLLALLENGYDMVSGWKKKRHDPLSKRLPSKVFNYFTSMLSGIRLHDFNCGLKAYRAQVVNSMTIYGELHRYLPVIAHQSGFRVTELPVVHHARKYGTSKFGAARFFRGAFDLLTITFLTRYQKRPLHLFGLMGLLSSLGGGLVLVMLLYQRLFHHVYLSNRPILFLGVLLIIVGVQFFSIGLLGEMLTSMRKNHPDVSIKKMRGFETDA